MIFHGFVAPFLRGIAGVNEFMEKKKKAVVLNWVGDITLPGEGATLFW